MRSPKADSLCQRRWHAIRVLICATAISLPALSTLANAVSLCASTAQELQDDLDKASTGGVFNGDDVEINLVAGTYNTIGSSHFIYSSSAATGQLILSGGWNPQCNGSKKDAAITVLDANGASQVLRIVNSNANVSVEYLTLQNGDTTADGGGLLITGTSVSVDHNIIRNNHTSDLGGGLFVQASGSSSQLDIGTNIISGNSADSGNGAGYVIAYNIGEAFITANTMWGNTTISNGPGGFYCCGSVATNPSIFANIFWQNTNCGLELLGSADLEYNDYGSVCGTAPSGDVGNISTDPKFVNAANGNFLLSSNSPALGYGPAAFMANYTLPTDISGHAYPLTGKSDLGAHAETIFTDSFDGG